MPIITFSVPQDVYDKIKGSASGGESENLAAKRIVLESLGVNPPTIPPSELEDIKARLEAVEHGLMVLAQAKATKTKAPNAGAK